MRKSLHLPVRGGDSLNDIRIVLLPYATDDWANLFQRLSSKYGKYNKTYNQDKSCHIIREPPGDNLHQKDCCALQVADRLSMVWFPPEQDIIEKIDIGGISLIRAGAKNFNDVVIVASKHQYQPLLEILNKQGAVTTREQRRWFAGEAFTVSSHYDTAIRDYFKK